MASQQVLKANVVKDTNSTQKVRWVKRNFSSTRKNIEVVRSLLLAHGAVV